SLRSFVSHNRPLSYLHAFPTRRSSDLYHASCHNASRCSTVYYVVGRGLCCTAKYCICAEYCTTRCGIDPSCKTASGGSRRAAWRSEEHTSELQSRFDIVCRLPLENKKN